jgi:hypothetical protein
LKRKTVEVSSKAVLLEELLLHEGTARKDLAAYVSLSSDSLVKQPGDQAIPTLWLPKEPSKKLKHPITIGCRFTVPVRSFRGAPSSRNLRNGAPMGGI